MAIVGNKGEVLIITQRGIALRTQINEIAIVSRLGKGGRVIRLDEGDKVRIVLLL